jgi:hypothetical protein
MRASRCFPAFFLLAVAISGCPTLPAPVLCGEIPEDGCPVGRGGTCDDVTCGALYDCVDGKWVSTKVCDHTGGGTGGGAHDGGVPPDGGQCTPVSIDTEGQATDCTPDLESPDCPVEAAFPCVETACLTGCVDFFLCTSMGWVDAAYCMDDGTFVIVK